VDVSTGGYKGACPLKAHVNITHLEKGRGEEKRGRKGRGK